ncbi:MAG TPA: hypothetical protein VHL54_07680 [Actinomycetota bacterium]|nr:hypothetical protein [Actinomycetota bacterium]
MEPRRSWVEPPLPKWAKYLLLGIVWLCSMVLFLQWVVLAIEQYREFPALHYVEWRRAVFVACLFGSPWMLITIVALRRIWRGRNSTRT